MKGTIVVAAIALVCVRATTDHRNDVRCLTCRDVTSPSMCMTSEQCALDEVCFTREIFDHQGRRAFRLGCESKALCDVAQSAHVFGRRHGNEKRSGGDNGAVTQSPTAKSSSLCFRCCASDECNQNLCEDAVGANRTDQGSHVGAPSHCPPGYYKGPNSCLHFSVAQANWATARDACKKVGASLVKIESKEEDLFILSKVESLPMPASSFGYWTGGHYDRLTGEFRWMDGSAFTYSRWATNQPIPTASTMFLVNPANTLARVPNWEWATGVESLPMRFICEQV